MDFSTYVEVRDGKENVLGKEVLQLNSNRIPRGLVALERAFDNKERVFVSRIVDKINNLEEVNLGTSQEPKNVYIGKCLSPRIRKI